MDEGRSKREKRDQKKAKERKTKERKGRKLTHPCAPALFCTAVPTHAAAPRRISASSAPPSSATSAGHSPRPDRALTLSMLSRSCSRPARARSLVGSGLVDVVGVVRVARWARIRVASDGPERREARAAAFGERRGADGVGKGGSLVVGKGRSVVKGGVVVVVGSLLVVVWGVVEELARDHLRRLFRFGSMLGMEAGFGWSREICVRGVEGGAERDRLLGADVVLAGESKKFREGRRFRRRRLSQ